MCVVNGKWICTEKTYIDIDGCEGEGKQTVMIDLTKLNGSQLTINAELIEVVEETPDTVITLTTGRKIIVKESRQEVKNLVKSYRKDVFA